MPTGPTSGERKGDATNDISLVTLDVSKKKLAIAWQSPFKANPQFKHVQYDAELYVYNGVSLYLRIVHIKSWEPIKSESESTVPMTPFWNS